jgi:hypothetical protein
VREAPAVGSTGVVEVVVVEVAVVAAVSQCNLHRNFRKGTLA